MAQTRKTSRKAPPGPSAIPFFHQPIHPQSAISANDFSVAEVRRILLAADALEKEDPLRRAKRLAKRRVALLFYESSTRTRTSFELAAKALGADTTLVSNLPSAAQDTCRVKFRFRTRESVGMSITSQFPQCSIVPRTVPPAVR